MAGGKTVALVVAAGGGSRAGGDTPKQYRKLAGKSVLAHALDRLRHDAIDHVQVVIQPGHEALYDLAVEGRTLPSPVLGGATRQDSVRNGLEALSRTGDVARVLIHDAARPFVPGAVIDRLTAALDTSPAAVPTMPVVDTLALGDESLGETVAREALVRVQTPQAFQFEAILAAHRSWSGGEATDDAQIARAAGFKVAMVAGDAALEKLTYEADFARAEAMLAANSLTCTGMGFDVHAFGPGTSLWLGGIEIVYERGLVGHSDADVVLHALTDALLGALGAGDIGDHFPPNDSQWRGAPSALFIKHARDLIDQAGGRIHHVDVTIICERPKIGPHRDVMRERVAALLRLPLGRVSIKATTTERLGFTGRGEGIAAQAIATVSLPEPE